MLSIDAIKTAYPLHWLVWNDEHQLLQDALQAEQVKNQWDIRSVCESVSACLSFFCVCFMPN